MTKRAIRVVAIAVAIVAVLFVLLLAASDTQRTSSVNFEIVGAVAPPIEGATLDGGTFDLHSHRGEWVVVNFFASWCVGCRVEHPELVEFSERHAVDDPGSGVKLVAVIFDDTAANARSFFAELGGSWPVLLTDTGRVAIDYGVTGIPETLLVSPSGRVVHKWIGPSGVTADELGAAISAASGGGSGG